MEKMREDGGMRVIWREEIIEDMEVDKEDLNAALPLSTAAANGTRHNGHEMVFVGDDGLCRRRCSV